MIIARFSIYDKLKKVWFFEKIFLIAYISIKTILGIPFLSLNNVNIRFAETSDFTWKNYTTTEALANIKRIEFNDKKQFAKAALEENAKIFVIHITALSPLLIYLIR